MSTVLFRRPARRRGPDMPEGELRLQEPPGLPEVTPDSSAVWNYLPMALMSVSMVLMYMRPGGSRSGVFIYLALVVMVISAAAMVLGQYVRRSSERKQQLNGERRDYLRYLRQVRRKVRKAVAEQQRALAWRHPAPDTLWSLVGTSRLWERRPGDEDFGEARVAVGEQKLSLRLAPLSTKPVEDLEPLSAHALRSFTRAYSTVPGQPIAVYLRTWARVLFRGDRERARALARAMVAQLAVAHSPQDLWIAVCAADERRAEWDWAKWLPHNLHGADSDGAGPVRMVVSSVDELDELLGPEFGERHPFEPHAEAGREEPYVVIVLDGVTVPGGHRADGPGFRNAVLLDLDGALTWRPGRATLRLDLDEEETLRLVRTDRERKEQLVVLGRPDAMSVASAASFAKRLAPFRMGVGRETSEPMAVDTELTTLLGIADLHRHEPASLWGRPARSERLRVPIAVGPGGTPVELDIKESAQGGTGPHGMLIGATGSGKSELLRTLVLALALTNSSETLNFVLVDFKGGATFLGLDELPHTSAVITNLADEVELVARMQDALHGELIRRQELLRAAGNHTSALEYEKARADGAPLAPLPSLFVVVDEFSELLAAHREFMELFVMIGRLGRSLGVHLLLASQRLDEGRMHQLESHLSYRIGLRTFSAMESRGVLGVPDAYELPPTPGSGFIKSGVEALTRFRAAYVSGPYRRRSGTAHQARVASQVVPWTSGWVVPRQLPDPPPGEAAAEQPADEGQSLLAVAVERMRDAGPPAHQVWLPPLGEPSTLDGLLGPLTPHPEYGLTALSLRGRLSAPVGIVDRPFEQRRDPLIVDLSAAGGHLGIAGGPQSGKSTLLRTLIGALALTHTPREAQFYCLDFGGGTLAGLAGLPHVGGVAARMDKERVGRVIAEVTAVLAHRERFFLDQGIDSMASYRRRRAAGEFPEEAHGDVFLAVDGWSTVRQDYDGYLSTFNALAARGLNYGVHLLITTSRWVELTAAVRDQTGTRLELRMGDPMDSTIDVRKAASVPRVPGRGLTRDSKLHYLAALPRVDGRTGSGDLSEGVADLVARVDEHWSGPPAPPVRTLPTLLPAAELPPVAADGDGLRIPLGVEEETMGTLWHDFSATPHLIVVGDAESGKTNLLRLAAKAIIERHTPAEARIMVVDYRRELVEAVPDAYRLGHAVSLDALKELVDGAARAVRTRVPGADIAPARMRLCDWWTGPRLFVLVDDYDMVGGGGPLNQPFGALMDHLALGYEVGMHLVVARSAAGAGRGLNDPLLRRMLEVNTPGILLSCPPTEGYVFGNLKGRNLIPGRGTRITRRKNVDIQTALVEQGSP
ncbi:type VII secretion protein EccCa [Streptomyces clavuligerus]|uniref:type VII secretion protein EccCa n=1 Tax=Streptomyces clavuligerus TaxID=1901 RepID=UPI0018CB9F81|nr:type VII secretion protein EccCa [Streptomyces clavuligerus]QPL66012.1 type VII secretion protein EccCa [Streptomyces clavuligerus]QPL71885.1 type VII secretion protein EccCa [Streptomyces clavuligerus]QPL78124.1 type VII secretion protein EccCa [Streptomyces clavuligerus]QPL84149.1 type VII secretion protein EccCa [Streptomyces clavuligerus]QPL86012.1 type VII secretion protein EccCa [Streptomyces clavuligerus]